MRISFVIEQKNRSVKDRAQHNKGCAWVVVVELKDEAALAQYGPHPEHTKVHCWRAETD